MKPMKHQAEFGSLPTEQLINELQSYGVRLADPKAGSESRRGGAGPSDHKPDHYRRHDGDGAGPYGASVRKSLSRRKPDAFGKSRVSRDGVTLGEVTSPQRPKFYDLTTADGIPYSRIALLHGRDVLATTVLQTCIRYQSRTKTCQFCAIGQSLGGGPHDRKRNPLPTGGSREGGGRPRRRQAHGDDDRHAAGRRSRRQRFWPRAPPRSKAAVDLPIQVQCEPPDDDIWFARMRDAGVDALGMHLEVVTDRVRQRIMPGKAQVPVARYFSAFAAAVPVFGRGQVSTYILAGLGDSSGRHPRHLRSA